MTAPAVRMDGISKRFGAVQANRAVNLMVAAGTAHGIVGENGAGKSTLMSILYGFYQADAGQIAVNGRAVQITGSAQAIALGIGMVHQHFMLVEPLTALDNILLGAEPHWRLDTARAQVRGRLEALMADTGLQVRLDSPVDDLPVGERQRLEILKALFRGAKILILDEPTAVLTPPETEALFVTLRRLRDAGTTLLLITHKLKEIMALCDAVTVMRQGAVVFDGPISQCSLDQLAEAMVGRRVHLGRAQGATAARPGAPLLQADGLCWRDALGVPRLADVSLTLRAGEIVGIAGVSGNGQGELLEMLAGMARPQAGTLALRGRSFTPAAWLDPASARRLGLAHVPEDRHRCGMVLPFAAWETAVLGYQASPRFAGRWGWMRRLAMRAATAQMMDAYDVRPRNPDLAARKFSGGNQQKLVLAREALAPEHAPTVLLVGQPTRGVDIGAIEFIHGRLRAMRDAGGAVLVVSSELDEILALSDRVLVMDRGRIAGELAIADCTEAALGRLMAGAAAEATA
ncbi:MAG TPA: ABC transporter ATP-binding protein [Aquabacterium sp.]|nr:ABC transporter ATP-binding protein [Aquabacterium sp.]HQC94469.1 ABC transporter ATP-binding protein [Aquabacterium sp.]